MSILSGNAIRDAIERGAIEITPFDPKALNPASYDLRLGRAFIRYASIHRASAGGCLDAKRQNDCFVDVIDDAGLVLQPRELYLMHTEEYVATNSYVPVLDGKSSIGRLGIWTHVSAGFGDPGFSGQWTLEVVCTLPVRVYAGMKFAQMRFHTIEGEVSLYEGNYRGETSRGPVPSRSWRQF